MSGEKVPDDLDRLIKAHWNDVFHYADSDNPTVEARDAAYATDQALRSAILAAIAAARAEAVEQAARVCEEAVKWGIDDTDIVWGRNAKAQRLAAVIRATLLPAPKQGDNERERA